MREIADRLIERGRFLHNSDQVYKPFTEDRDADALVNDLASFPHAFVIACIVDRQVKAEVAWKIPYELSKRLGGFDFDFLESRSREAIAHAFSKPKPLHRYPDVMSDIVYEAIQRIREVHQGNAATIWSGRPSSAEVVLRLLRFKGVGPKIATMAANILVRHFKVKLADHYCIDVSADVHVRRVFFRLGLIQEHASVEEVIYRARSLYPEFPGLMDLPAWEIGRLWCRPMKPNCNECPLNDICPSSTAETA